MRLGLAMMNPRRMSVVDDVVTTLGLLKTGLGQNEFANEELCEDVASEDDSDEAERVKNKDGACETGEDSVSADAPGVIRLCEDI